MKTTKRRQKANLTGAFLFAAIIMGLVPLAFTFPSSSSECGQCHTDSLTLGLSSNATGTVDVEVGVSFVVEFTADNGTMALAIGSDWADNEQFAISDNLIEDNDAEDTDATDGVITALVTFTPLFDGEYTIRAWAAAHTPLGTGIDVIVSVGQSTTSTTPTTTTTSTPIDGEPGDPMPVLIAVGGGALILILAFSVSRRRRESGKPKAAAPIEPPPPKEIEEPGEIMEEVQVLRGCAPVGGKFEYKVKIKNDTPFVILSVTVTIVDYPRDCMELEAESTKRIEKIEPSGFRSPQFTFIPTKDCVEGRILASVSYVDYENNLETVEVEPLLIRSVCDLLEPLESTLDEFELILSDMSATRDEHSVDWNPEVLFLKASKLLPNRNFYLIEASGAKENGLFRGVIRGLAEGKYTRKKVAVRIVISGAAEGDKSEVVVEGLGEDPAMLPTTIEEIARGIEEWICLSCGSGLDSEQVIRLKTAGPVECQHCGRTMTRDLYRKE